MGGRHTVFVVYCDRVGSSVAFLIFGDHHWNLKFIET